MGAASYVFLFLLAGAAAQADDACVTSALADTAPAEAAADAISDAFAETLAESIICEDGTNPDQDAVEGLSMAVVLAVCEANTIAVACTADAEAAAKFVIGFVTDELANGLVGSAGDGDNETLAKAWLMTRGPDIMELVSEVLLVLGDDGCLDLSTTNLTSTTDVGELLSNAVTQILTAVQCGTNVMPTDEPCRWENLMYIGRCLAEDGGEAPPPPAVQNMAACFMAFNDCRSDGGEGCDVALSTCLEEAPADGCQYC